VTCTRCGLEINGSRAWHDPSDCIHAIGDAIVDLARELAEERQRAAAAARELGEVMNALRRNREELAELRKRRRAK
jgi:hypothetical protein